MRAKPRLTMVSESGAKRAKGLHPARAIRLSIRKYRCINHLSRVFSYPDKEQESCQDKKPHMYTSMEEYILNTITLDAPTRQAVMLERVLHPRKPFSEIILSKSVLSKEDLLSLLSKKTSLAALSQGDLLSRAQALLSKDLSQKWQALVVGESLQHVDVAFVDFDNLPLRDEIAHHFNRTVRPFIMMGDDFACAFEHLYGSNREGSLVQDTQGLKLVHELLSEGIRASASDIHIQPGADRILIKHRIDGVLCPSQTLPLEAFSPLLSSLKVAAHLDVGESRKPQHGRYLHPFADRRVDLRMSTHPTISGENIVIRILDKMHGLKSLDALGFSTQMCTDLRKLIHQPSGMIIFTGPTGSGKTTTLYALLRDLDQSSLNIMTLEDPVEYHIPGIRQTEVSKNLSYASGVRSLLRQDPDVILLGEIRDEETANMALRASMTGHLVLTTLHTPDIFTVPARLRDLGVSMDVLAANLLGVVSQRLLRTYCHTCQGKGCIQCKDTGYKGRISVGEYMILNEESRANLRTSMDLRAHASLTLREDAESKLKMKVTSRAEIQRVCG